jgi:RNA polymerase sigma-70 factor (ECF subfamily)
MGDGLHAPAVRTFPASMAIQATRTSLQPQDERSPGVEAAPDAAALGKIYDTHLPRIYEFFARRIEDRSIAEELTTATFERAFGAAGRDGAPGSVAGFLYRVAASAVVDHARRRRKPIPKGVRARDHDKPGDREAAEALANEAATRSYGAAIERSRLRQAFTRLPDEDRNLIVLRYFDGLEIDEICAITGASRQSLAIDLHRALRALRAATDVKATDAA